MFCSEQHISVISLKPIAAIAPPNDGDSPTSIVDLSYFIAHPLKLFPGVVKN
jgi:hypothetical protein